jgi:hypothetical protein
MSSLQPSTQNPDDIQSLVRIIEKKVCATSCVHLSVEFSLPLIVKLTRGPYFCGWPYGEFSLLLKEHSSVFVNVGEREGVERDSFFMDFSMGT